MKQALAEEARVALAAVGVQDPKLCPPSRRAEAVARDHRLRLLADDVATEPDPRSASELEPHAGRFADRRTDRRSEPGRLEDDEQRVCTPGERAEAMQPVGHLGRPDRPVRSDRKIHDEQVDGPALEEGAGHRERLVERRRREDDQPLRPHAARHGLDRIECPSNVEPRHDRPAHLRFGGKSQSDRRLARRVVAPKSEAGAPRNAARQDGIECRESGPDDVVARRSAGLLGQRYGRQRADDLAASPRSCGSPAHLKGR